MFEENMNSMENEGAFVDQTSVEESEIDSFDPAEASEDGEFPVGACAVAGGVGAAVALGVTWVVKKVSESPKVQEFRDSRKEKRELRKEKRTTIKTIKSEMKEKFDDLRHKKTEKSEPEVSEDQSNENKKSSKK